MAAPIARLEGAVKRYDGVTALDHVTLSVEPGEWLAVMGPSGSGKTTLLNLLGGLDRPDSGVVEVAGQVLTDLDDEGLTRYRRDHVGLVFQQFHLLPYLTALENVMVAQHYHSMADPKEAGDALARVGLGDLQNRRPSQLSGGEQQRVCIARALINHPELLLADEPTGNLDEENERRVLEIFSDLRASGHTLITVTHAEHVGGLADRRVTLAHGHVADVSVKPAKSENGDRVRRHRLAECLMASTLRLPGAEGEVAHCRVEHLLDSEVADAVCALLGHPSKCPHGKPIPAGPCCPPR